MADEGIGVDFLERLPDADWLNDQVGRIDILHYHWLDGLYMNRFLTPVQVMKFVQHFRRAKDCLLYTSDAADERSSVDLGGRRIIKKKNREHKYSTLTNS